MAFNPIFTSLKVTQDNISTCNIANTFLMSQTYHNPTGEILRNACGIPKSDAIYKAHVADFNSLEIVAGSSILMGNGDTSKIYTFLNNEIFGATLCVDTSYGTAVTLEHGRDYYVYLYQYGEADDEIVPVVSLNSSYPDDGTQTSPYTAENTRKIGGFHVGTVRCVNSDGIAIDKSGVVIGSASTWFTNVVPSMLIPNSVWDLYDTNQGRTTHRDGTVMIGGSFGKGKIYPSDSASYSKLNGQFWCDIYLNKQTGNAFVNAPNVPVNGKARFASQYGQLVAQYYVTRLYMSYFYGSQSGKLRLLTANEWFLAAVGSPQGEDTGNLTSWTATSNKSRTYSGCFVNTSNGTFDKTAGLKSYAVSSWNVTDCVGNVRDITSTIVALTSASDDGTFEYDWESNAIQMSDKTQIGLSGISHKICDNCSFCLCKSHTTCYINYI